MLEMDSRRDRRIWTAALRFAAANRTDLVHSSPRLVTRLALCAACVKRESGEIPGLPPQL